MAKLSFWRRFGGGGLRLKRWLLFSWVGFFFLGLAMALGMIFALFAIPANLETARSFYPMGYVLGSLAAAILGVVWLLAGLRGALVLFGRNRADAPRRVRDLLLPSGKRAPLPSVVAFGGGTGLSMLLKGLKRYPIDLTAVVTVTDDGGSSGRLRQEYNVPPPGDIRNCLVALSRRETLLARLFQHRFGEGTLGGHTLGNLLITGLTEVLGDFASAVRETSNILAIDGRVLPVTLDNVQLQADFADGQVVTGESAICAQHGRITALRLVLQSPPSAHTPGGSGATADAGTATGTDTREGARTAAGVGVGALAGRGTVVVPARVLPTPEVLTAIDQARLLILGPGSLYTSVIPNLLVPEVAERINRSHALVVYICNVMTQPGETDGFAAVDHVRVLMQQTPLTRIDVAVVNSRRAPRELMARYASMGQSWVAPTVAGIEALGVRVVTGDFLGDGDLLRHDAPALAEVLLGLLAEMPVGEGGGEPCPGARAKPARGDPSLGPSPDARDGGSESAASGGRGSPQSPAASGPCPPTR